MQKVKRLYSQFMPQSYQLHLSVEPDKERFHGRVTIVGHKAGRPSERITLHQKALRITGATLTKHDKTGGSRIVKVDRINTHDRYDEVRLHANELLYPGKYTLEIEFSGRITRVMNGMYPSVFKHGGRVKQIISTQFESHHAREVFPCIDEPEAKATFDLELETPLNDTVVSNTPVKAEKRGKDSKVTAFETTPIMSTYLLAFATGQLEYLEKRTKHGDIRVRCYATPDNVKFTDFALDVAVKCLDFYQEYFDIEYPLEKCDLIALPDFASGAMENWGCITFREQTLLVDPVNSTLVNKQYVALVVAHELAHQWFGNLVTMRWWTDLWLNEGFASWIEYLAIDKLFPAWEVWTQFIVDEQHQALKLDSLEHTHPIEVVVNHPDEIRTIFDAISYSKGASIIHMLYRYLGPEEFQSGLRFYLNKHSYANTDTVDLWDALETVSGKPVKDFMHHWTALPGFPLLKAEVEDNKVRVRQDRFYVNPSHKVGSNNHWPIALQADEEHVPDILDKVEDTFSRVEADKLKFNRLQSGFYRVAYNESHLEKLGVEVERGKFSAIDRLGLLSDVFETAKAGLSGTAEALYFMRHFKSEDNYAVWDVIASAVGSIRLVMEDEKLRETMKPYIRQLTNAQLKRLGWDQKTKDSHFDKLLRPIILGLSASADEPAVVKQCKTLFDSIDISEAVEPHLRSVASARRLRRGRDIDPDLRGTVFGTMARLGNEKTYKKLVALHNTALLSEERVILSAAVTGFKDPKIIQQSLAMIKSDDIRLQDVAYWLAYSFLNRHARGLTWQWMKDNWEWLAKNLGNDLSFYRMPLYSARVFSDKDFLEDYRKFFKSVMTPAMERSFNQGLEMIRWQSAWRERAFAETENFFSRQH